MQTIYKIRVWGVITLVAIIFAFNQVDKSVNHLIDSIDEQTNAYQEELYKAKVEEDKNTILECLSYLESNHNSNLKVLDSNNKYSYGAFQFQISTLTDEFPESSNAERIAIAKDYIHSKEVAKRMIFEEGKWAKWYNSFKKMENGRCPLLLEPDILNNYIN